MNILFLTIGAAKDISQSGVYTDLLRYFDKKGHNVYVVCASEKRENKKTWLENAKKINILHVRTGNITKTRFIEKGISTLFITGQYNSAIKKYWGELDFDIILYSTPPITLAGVVKHLKKNSSAFCYLMLKDIFPDGAVDLGTLSNKGIRGYITKYFRNVEKRLYDISDYIGCMSEKNIEYLLKHNPKISKDKVGLCPNTIDVLEKETISRKCVCDKYGIPNNKLLFVYGGNFGLPQNINFVLQALEAVLVHSDVYFIMCGSGMDFYKVEEYAKTHSEQVTIIQALPFCEYRKLLSVCDVGLLFLDYRFKVPNFPSRLVDYMNCELPVLAATDINTDVGEKIMEGDFGWWCESNKTENFVKKIEEILEKKADEAYLINKGKNAKKYLEKHYRTEVAFDSIINQYNEWKERYNVN